MSILYSAASSLGFAIFFNLHGKKLWAATAGGAVGWLFYLIMQPYGETAQFIAASAAITVYSEIMARVQKAPATIYLAPALIPLVPGGLIYEAMRYALNGENELFMLTGLRAMIITGALALGIVASSSLAHLFAIYRVPKNR